MFDNIVTRLRNGLVNARDTETFSDLPVLDYSKLHDYLDDFDYYTGPVAVGTTNGYTLSGTGATAALAAGDGGLLNLIGATTGFTASLQRATGNFKTQLGYALWFESIVTLDALGDRLLVGLTDITATPFAAITDGIYLDSAVTTGELSVNVAVGGVVTTVDTGVQVVAGSPLTFKAYWDGGLYAAPNGRVVWEVSGAGASAAARGEIAAPANYPGAALLAPIAGILGTAGTPTLSVDLLMAVKARINPNATPTF